MLGATEEVMNQELPYSIHNVEASESVSKHYLNRGDGDRRRIRRKYTDPLTDQATTNPKAPHKAPTNLQSGDK